MLHRYLRVWPSPAPLVCSKYLLASSGLLPHVAFLIDEFLVDSLDQKVLQAACKSGAPLYILEFIVVRTAPDWKEVVNAAAQGGHIHVFKWLTGLQDERGPWRTDFDECFEYAARYGHSELVKWLYHQQTLTIHRCTLHSAACNGHLALAQWLHEHTSSIYIWETMQCVVGRGHFEVVRWLYKTSEMARKSPAMWKAVERGHLDILKWLHQQGNCPESCNSSVMDSAVQGGHFYIVKWLHDNCSKGCSKYAPEHAARNGDFAMLQWLHQHYSSQFGSRVMDGAAYGGHLEIVEWLHEHRTEGCTTRAMDTAAGGGHLHVVQWLHANRAEGCTIHAMDWAVDEGRLDVVRWLHENRAEGCSDSMMRLAARKGYLDIVKWCNETGCGRGSDSLVAAAWEGHLDVVCYLAEDRRQLGSGWGLGTAAGQGHLQVLVVLVDNYYSFGTILVTRNAIANCIRKTLSQLSDVQASTAFASSWSGILESVNQFHTGGFFSCVGIVLVHALQRGYTAMVRQFFKDKDELVKGQYVSVAGEQRQIPLLRWLVSNGTPLDVPTAIELATKKLGAKYLEATSLLAECDRVTLVQERLRQKKYDELLLWVLDKSASLSEGSRATIRTAIKQQDDAAEWLANNLSNDEVRSWCGQLK